MERCIYQGTLLLLALVNTHLIFFNVNSKENPWTWLCDFLKNHDIAPVQEMMRLIVEFNQNWIFVGKYDEQREEKGG